MRLLPLSIFVLTFVPSLVSASLYSKDSLVKMVDTKGFRNALKENRTSVVAFVASWCGYCKAMVPEYSKAALGLHPLIPLYAVDCDENRSLCAEQGVKGFPTVKLYPRGKEQAPILFEHPDRSASAFFYFATRRVPHKNKKLHTVEETEPWVNDKIDQTRVLLLSKAKDIPLMWKVLANKYRDDFAFANHCDLKGKSSEALGYDAGTQKESKILVYPAGSNKPFLFEGTLKYNSISNFFNSILDGTANLIARNTEVLEDSHKLVPEEQEIERGQMDDSDKEEGDTNEREEDIIHRAIRIQLEKEEREAKDAHIDSLLKTRTTDPVEVEQRTAAETAHPFNMKAPSDKEPLPSPEDPTSESGRIKDEL
ncbi:hypothetical protein BGY98DRAFT_960147 [Russula aff. rugulosa BPL654]|nr:hypothetical protein BGY98DRAFT_960147 [Russula aff. rugulosa BPL654]